MPLRKPSPDKINSLQPGVISISLGRGPSWKDLLLHVAACAPLNSNKVETEITFTVIQVLASYVRSVKCSCITVYIYEEKSEENASPALKIILKCLFLK